MGIPNKEIDQLMQFATEVIRRLGEEAGTYYGRGNPAVKFDEELVTEAELHLTGRFSQELSARYPGHQVFNRSQQGELEYTHQEKRYLWIYDAIDGIANFQAGIPVWGTSLALLENFWPLLGVVHLPVTGELFYARAGGTAFCRNEEIRVYDQEDINDESILLTYSRFHRHYRTTFPGKIRNFGCTVAHLCYVALGRADAAILTNDSYAGLAAAGVILEAAGGKIYTMNGGEFFLSEYLGGERISEHLLVVRPEAYDQVRSCLQGVS